MYKLKIVIIQRVFSHYRKPFFDQLSERYDLIVLHGKQKSTIQQINAPYSKITSIINYLPGESFVYLKALRTIKKINPDIIIYEFSPSILSIFRHLWFARKKCIKFILWGQGFNRKKEFRPRRNLSSYVRLYLLKLSDAIIVYGKQAYDILNSSITEPNKIFVAPNSLDVKKLVDIRKRLETIGRDKIKKDLNVSFKYVLLFVGRLIKSKNPDLLLSLFEQFQKTDIGKDIQIIIIGEGPLKKELTEEVLLRNYNNQIKILGGIYDDWELGKFFFISDFLIIPGEIGLVINHSFAFGCPVATFKGNENGPWHGPEIELLLPNINGILCSSKDISVFSEKIRKMLSEPDLHQGMKENIKISFDNNDRFSNMLEGFRKAIDYVSIR